MNLIPLVKVVYQFQLVFSFKNGFLFGRNDEMLLKIYLSHINWYHGSTHSHLCYVIKNIKKQMPYKKKHLFYRTVSIYILGKWWWVNFFFQLLVESPNFFIYYLCYFFYNTDAYQQIIIFFSWFLSIFCTIGLLIHTSIYKSGNNKRGSLVISQMCFGISNFLHQMQPKELST